MPILKFWTKKGLVLDNLILEDITEFAQVVISTIVPILDDVMNKPDYQLDKTTYIVENDLAFKLLNVFKGGKRDALLYTKEDKRIVVVPSGSYIFWNGKSVDPMKYEFNKTEAQITAEINSK